jgi:hypothetical protein
MEWLDKSTTFVAEVANKYLEKLTTVCHDAVEDDRIRIVTQFKNATQELPKSKKSSHDFVCVLTNNHAETSITLYPTFKFFKNTMTRYSLMREEKCNYSFLPAGFYKSASTWNTTAKSSAFVAIPLQKAWVSRRDADSDVPISRSSALVLQPSFEPIDIGDVQQRMSQSLPSAEYYFSTLLYYTSFREEMETMSQYPDQKLIQLCARHNEVAKYKETDECAHCKLGYRGLVWLYKIETGNKATYDFYCPSCKLSDKVKIANDDPTRKTSLELLTNLDVLKVRGLCTEVENYFLDWQRRRFRSPDGVPSDWLTDTVLHKPDGTPIEPCRIDRYCANFNLSAKDFKEEFTTIFRAHRDKQKIYTRDEYNFPGIQPVDASDNWRSSSVGTIVSETMDMVPEIPGMQTSYYWNRVSCLFNHPNDKARKKQLKREPSWRKKRWKLFMEQAEASGGTVSKKRKRDERKERKKAGDDIFITFAGTKWHVDPSRAWNIAFKLLQDPNAVLAIWLFVHPALVDRIKELFDKAEASHYLTHPLRGSDVNHVKEILSTLQASELQSLHWIEQRHGDMILVPVGFSHIVFNCQPSVKIAADYIPVFGTAECVYSYLFVWTKIPPSTGSYIDFLDLAANGFFSYISK